MMPVIFLVIIVGLGILYFFRRLNMSEKENKFNVLPEQKKNLIAWSTVMLAGIIIGAVHQAYFVDNGNTSAVSKASSSSSSDDSDYSDDTEEEYSDSEESSSDYESSDEGNAKAYENKLNSLNKGTAQFAEYDSDSNTVTWTGYEDWSNWTNDELQDSMDILETITNQQSIKFGYQSPSIVVQLPNKTVIARGDGSSDIEFVK